MEVLYLDRLFAVNLAVDYCLLLLTARFCGGVLRRWRLILGALLGAAYAAASVLPGWTWLSHPALKLALGCLMALAAFGSEPELGRHTLVFFAVAALFGGGVYAASLLAGTEPLRGPVPPLSWRVFALSFAVCYAVTALLFRRRMKRAARQRVTVRVRLGARERALTGLRDSGNDLHDPVSGRAAAVADRAALGDLLPRDLPEDPAAALAALGADAQLRGRFRLLPYRTVGASGLLLAFLPDALEADGRREDALIALSPTPLGEEGCQILLPPES